VAYVPTTALLARTSLFAEIGTFDEALPMGEDVDLMWRTVAAGHVIRYEPRSVARHPTRRDLRAWMRQMLDDPWRESWELAGKGQLAAWRPIASAVTRTWWPAALGAAVVSRRARRAVALAAVVPPLVDWANGDRALDPIRYTGLRVLDDLAYGAGVWAGCRRHGTIAPLRPTLRSWPGRGPVAEVAPGGVTPPG
jgi:mycofactocin glycosyltransferase